MNVFEIKFVISSRHGSRPELCTFFIRSLSFNLHNHSPLGLVEYRPT